MAALVGVMFVVCYHTFDWKSFKFYDKPKQDVVIMLIVTASTVIFNLAYAVILGVLLTLIVNQFIKNRV